MAAQEVGKATFGTLFNELLANEPTYSASCSDVHSAELALAMEHHEFRRGKLESITSAAPYADAKGESAKIEDLRSLHSKPFSSQIDQKAPMPSSGRDMKSLIGTMDSAISDGKRTLRQRLDEAMTQSARRAARKPKEVPSTHLTRGKDEKPSSSSKRMGNISLTASRLKKVSYWSEERSF